MTEEPDIDVNEEKPNVIIVAEDELIYGKIVKYHPGASYHILGNLKEAEHVKFHQEILNDWFDNGYIQTAFRIVGPRKRLFYVFTKIKLDIVVEVE